MSANLKQFNTTLREFLTKLVTIFPKTKTEILNQYRPLLENGEFNDYEYCKEFMSRVVEYQHDIANKNEEIFRHSICLFPGIDFEVIWNSDFNTAKTKKSIWIYLSVFCSLGQRILDELKKKDSALDNMTDEDRLLRNLSDATKEYTEDQLNSKEKFLRTISDKELMRELERRKENRVETNANADDEEDLLNFDPQQGYSLMNAIKGITGGAGSGLLGNLGSMGGIMDMASKTFGIDLSKFDFNNFDIGNIGNMVKEVMTPENIEKMKEQVSKFASEFQTDLDTGNIDKSELMKMFTTVKDNIQNMTSGKEGEDNGDEAVEGEDSGKEGENKNSNMMEQMMESTQKMFSNMIPPHMRDQFDKLQREVMRDPSKLAEMMQNPEALMKGMMGDNSAAANRFSSNTRNQQARNRLSKKYEEKQLEKQLAEQKAVTNSTDKLPNNKNNKPNVTNEQPIKLNIQNLDDQDLDIQDLNSQDLDIHDDSELDDLNCDATIFDLNK